MSTANSSPRPQADQATAGTGPHGEKRISVIIPNYNGSATIGKCLEAAFASSYGNFEVIVVDDCSADGSAGVVRQFPCRVVQLEKRTGAAGARNAGARESRGEILFFTDADCLLEPGALAAANRFLSERGPDTVVGGTYTMAPYDQGFFSTFQSVFINYSEMKRQESPDYIATHAMAIDALVFRRSGGFSETFLPILEDVEFSHRLSRSGCRLMMSPEISVRHIFYYSLAKSLRNAFRKTKYWIAYSLGNRDLLADSGTASSELKLNGTVYLLSMLLLLFSLLTGKGAVLAAVPALLILNLVKSRDLLGGFFRARGAMFAVLAALYYTLLYPAAIWAGAAAGIGAYVLGYHRVCTQQRGI